MAFPLDVFFFLLFAYNICVYTVCELVTVTVLFVLISSDCIVLYFCWW